MNKVDSSEKLSQIPAPAVDDIPVALRDTPQSSSQLLGPKQLLLLAGLGLVALALFAGFGFAVIETRSVASRPAEPATPATAEPAESQTAAATPSSANTLLGHFQYEEAPASELAPVSADSSVKMRRAAAEAFQAMQAAASADGVSLVPLSAFRSVEDQQHLFFDVKAERGQTATKRAEVSAPPGYSEHHTGYAVDIGDGNVPAANVSPDFEHTSAFKWLEANAARYSFEISFPKGNAQGVNYESWHWRFVGDINSLETFYKARGKK
ncbi:M15 family metallopeptidase [Kamptonema formosum]|uniref:M15 family metallopeptidase n=1 Tax=Kamptonema formosum TaxID=331992 RepID=UPI00034A3A98|nr:M15 family metallopeptidase [Oscillatoria sp. PCC 10802]